MKIYPYRIVPSLPAKKAVGKADQRLAEHRCRRLQIFLDMLLGAGCLYVVGKGNRGWVSIVSLVYANNMIPTDLTVMPRWMSGGGASAFVSTGCVLA